MNRPNKIVITGTSGSGKTTLGHKVSNLIGRKMIDLDDLFWLPNWKPRPDDEFIDLVQKEVFSSEWIICGNYTRSQKLIWPEADIIIWLDFPLFTCL